MRVEVSISGQRLTLLDSDDRLCMDTAISTARNGAGELIDSECTPRGRHLIRAKIGESCPINTVFVGRRPTGEIYTASLRARFPKRDWILTRILWLSGTLVGVNRLGSVDTMQRYIYIHGCPEEDRMGIPSSHGCIKMKNSDVLKLFNHVGPGTAVQIEE